MTNQQICICCHVVRHCKQCCHRCKSPCNSAHECEFKARPEGIGCEWWNSIAKAMGWWVFEESLPEHLMEYMRKIMKTEKS